MALLLGSGARSSGPLSSILVLGRHIVNTSLTHRQCLWDLRCRAESNAVLMLLSSAKPTHFSLVHFHGRVGKNPIYWDFLVGVNSPLWSNSLKANETVYR